MFSNGAPAHNYGPGTFKLKKLWRKDQCEGKGITVSQMFYFVQIVENEEKCIFQLFDSTTLDKSKLEKL